MKNFQFEIFLCCIIGISCAANSSPCGEWKPYKEEKCFKILDKIGTFEDAEKTCSQLEADASLVSIKSQEEQEFISHFVFETSKVVDNVWLGAIRIKSNNSKKFKWINGFNLDYSNWEKEHPTNEDDRDCIQMNSAYEFYFQNSKSNNNLTLASLKAGEWVDVPCQKKNLVVCEKLQNWSISRLQKILLDSLENINIQLKNQQSTISTQQSTINHLKQNPIPINFIYTQLSSQPNPQSLWPTVEWEDVTSEYSGLFFRAEGNNSADFGRIQEENAPRVTKVEYTKSVTHLNITNISLQPNSWSKWFRNGGIDGYDSCIRFYTSPEEVRPRNMAIRIWKRTG